MPNGFGTSIASLNAARWLASSSAQLQRSFERLSSGLRIVRPSDDAAGLSIADKLRVDARITAQASRNINDGLSMLNIMDGVLEQQGNILTRLAELAEQSINGTFSNSQRQTLNLEYQALLREFGRLGDEASFNGHKMLRAHHSDGMSSLAIQAGIDKTTNSQLQLNGIESSTLSGVFNYHLGGVFSSQVNETEEQLFALFHYKMLNHQITLGDGRKVNALLSIESDSFDETAITVNVFVKPGDVGINDPSPYALISGGVGNDRFDLMTDPETGYSKLVNGTVNIATTIGSSLDTTIRLDLSGMRFFWTGQLAPDYSGPAQNPTTDQARVTAIDYTDIRFKGGAEMALTIVRNRLSELSRSRGQLGAFQSRLGSAFTNNQQSMEQLRAAESQIRDVDIAAETMMLVRSQILQQSGLAILGSANQQSRYLLDLLR